MLDKDRVWEVVQVVEGITPGNPHYSEKSRVAKTLLKDGQTWGRRATRRICAGARQQPNDLLYLPHVMDNQLLRLSPGDDGQQEIADAPQRRADDSQLYLVQFRSSAQ